MHWCMVLVSPPYLLNPLHVTMQAQVLSSMHSFIYR